VVAVPPFRAEFLNRGHAVHFRCARDDVRDLRIDVMALPDLVLAKKTQRDKDWPMIRRLVERHYDAHRGTP